MSDAWLPPDQIATTGWPVVGERAPGVDVPARWPITIDGLVEAPREVDLAWVRAWRETLCMDVHCVTRWSHRGMTFEGLPLARLLDMVRPQPTATVVRFGAWSTRDHDTTLPLDVARAQCWIVHRADGADLTTPHGGPVRVVTQGRYFYKSLKWLRQITLLDADPLGYWERTDGYHNHADPWPGDERYITGNLTGADLARFKAATRYRRWHGKTIRRAPLRGWAPSVRALGPLALKGCDIRDAQLAGCDLAGANLSLSDLRGADLTAADLRGADLEGAVLIGADLRGADLRETALTATAFFDATAAAQIKGARFDGAFGMLDTLRDWLRARGVTL